MVRLRQCSLVVAACVCLGGAAHAQTNPLASISGRVTDPSGAPLGGVTVSAASPALQGVRDGRTTAAGDFLIQFLPPGDYEIVFRRDGFREARAERSLRATETSRLDTQLEVAGTAVSMTVSAEPPSVIGQSATMSTTYPARLIDRLPVDRSLRGAMLLAPGVAATGLNGNVMIAGAMTYENLYLVDGVSVKELVLGQARPYPIEDALEETSTAVAGISAEYGRFTGGVVNAITRSGGDEFSGSLRVTLQNEAWRALTPYEREVLAADPREDSVVPATEGTLGGPVLREKLWFFLAGRWQKTTRAQTLDYTNLPYRYEARETRFEAKATWLPAAGQNLRIAYGQIDTREENRVTAPAMDYASLTPLTTPENLLSIHANSMAGRNVFLEAQYAQRHRAPTGLGARTTDLVAGTVLRDGSKSTPPRWNSPQFCAVCGVAPGELRKADESDQGFVAKASGLFSGPRAGAHQIVVGGEIADELRQSNSFQSGSGYTVTASNVLLQNGSIYPVFLPGSLSGTLIEYNPIRELSKGGRFRTTSAFVNDSWRLGNRWSFNLGLRWDKSDSRDQSGVTVSGGGAWSPRLAAAFDPRGDGAWTIDAGYARYVASVNFNVGDSGTGAGRPDRFLYDYFGPPVNGPGSPFLVSTDQALSTLFSWFFANSQTPRQAPVIRGLNNRVGQDLVPPRSDETTLGVTRRIGALGSVRLAGVRRVYSDQYSTRADTSTGKVADPESGRLYDMSLVENSDRVKRTYEALLVQIDLRIRRDLRVAGSYTLSATHGNFDGDDASALGGSTPETDLNFFPEYGEERWRAPSGPLKSDQRHRARLWASYDVPLDGPWGRLSVSALERIDSGQAWGAVGMVDSRKYVTNPGYESQGPPSRVPYFFEARGARRTETVVATDLSLLYAVSPPGFRQAEVFARVVVVNLFDQSAQTRPGNTTVYTAANDPQRRGYAPFDPFTQEAVRGVNWDYAPGFANALSADDFAQPRTLTLAFGLRF